MSLPATSHRPLISRTATAGNGEGTLNSEIERDVGNEATKLDRRAGDFGGGSKGWNYDAKTTGGDHQPEGDRDDA